MRKSHWVYFTIDVNEDVHRAFRYDPYSKCLQTEMIVRSKIGGIDETGLTNIYRSSLTTRAKKRYWRKTRWVRMRILMRSFVDRIYVNLPEFLRDLLRKERENAILSRVLDEDDNNEQLRAIETRERLGRFYNYLGIQNIKPPVDPDKNPFDGTEIAKQFKAFDDDDKKGASAADGT